MGKRTGKTVEAPSYSLIDNLKTFVNNSELSDVLFVCGQGSEQRKISAHRCILSARCEVFSAMFSDPQGADPAVPLILPDVRPSIFLIILDYIYTGTFVLNQDVAIDVLATSIEYGLEELRKLTLGYIHDTLSADNACPTLQAAVTYRQDELEETCFAFIEKNTEQVFNSRSFVELSEAVLKDVLLSDKLTCNEYTVLKAVKEWGTVNSVVTGKSLAHIVKPVIDCVRFPLLKQTELKEVEQDNETSTYIPMRLISYAWRSHALKDRNTDNPQTRPRLGTSSS